MGTVMSWMFRFLARVWASVSESSEVKQEGMKTPRRFSGPRASLTMQATRAESRPPDRPSVAVLKPDFWK